MAVKHPSEHLDQVLQKSFYLHPSRCCCRKKRLTICFHFIVCTSSS
ncbi:hypothetical protein ALC60_00718 [Trachymyrmex zeteki]|uniref:Uncharacterized protein n=1 Tax=Mycetomoellerius zeteki TaxID=64791 RepID=A0A151XJB9_9HYME|nr:hypothetical protein ALC60_00718 [Trachymyrmex zeteki]